ncbi:MAG: hypothetical protein ACYSX1_11215, partial [Planctomycetota bacterium]
MGLFDELIEESGPAVGLLEEPATEESGLFGELVETPEKPFPEFGRRVIGKYGLSESMMDDWLSGRAPLGEIMPRGAIQMGTIIDKSVDPEGLEADISSALYYSIELDKPFEWTFKNIDQLNAQAFGRKLATKGHAWGRIQERYRGTKALIQQGDLGRKIMKEVWSDPEAFERHLKEIEQLGAKATNPDDRADFRGFWEKNFSAAAEQVPYLAETVKVAPKGAVIGGIAGGVIGGLGGIAVPTVGEEPGAIAGGAALGMKAGAGTAGAIRIAEIEAGMHFVDLMMTKDQYGNRMNPKLAMILSHPVGTINGLWEVSQWAIGLKAFGITDKMFGQAARVATSNIVRKGALRRVALETVENFAVALSSETMVENAQETTNIVFEELAVQ